MRLHELPVMHLPEMSNGSPHAPLLETIDTSSPASSLRKRPSQELQPLIQRLQMLVADSAESVPVVSPLFCFRYQGAFLGFQWSFFCALRES
jgi:hypothetical protein